MSNIYKLITKQFLENQQNQKQRTGLTNQILIKTDNKEQKNLQIYIPAYLRVLVNSFDNLDKKHIQAQLQCQIQLILKLGQQFKPLIIQHVRQNTLLFSQMDDVVCLNQKQQNLDLEIRQDKQFIEFSLCKTFKTFLDNQPFWTPFDYTDLKLTLRPKIKQLAGNNITLKFHINLMEIQGNPSIVSETQVGNHSYQIAKNNLKAQFSNCDASLKAIKKSAKINRLNQQNARKFKDQTIIKPFEYAHFIVPLYHSPIQFLVTILMPLILIGIISLGISAQSNALGGRIQNNSALMFAVVQIFLLIRLLIPQNQTLTFAQFNIGIYMVLLMSQIIRSIVIRGDGEPVDVWTDTVFLVLLSFIIYMVLLLFAILIIFYCFYRPKNRYKRVQKNEVKILDTKNWYNYQCENHFVKFLDDDQLTKLNQEILTKIQRLNNKNQENSQEIQFQIL